MLKKYGVHATFFQTGRHVASQPAVARAVLAAGHRIGNHTRHHPQAVRGSMPYGSFDTLSASTQSSELDSASSTIVRATGAYPCFFRAPGGHDASDLTRRLVADRRMTLVHWSVSSGDSGQPGRLTAGATSRIVANATRSPGLHPVVLMHDGKASAEPESALSSYRGNTVAALPRIIRWYKARHYVFVDPAGRKF